MTRLAERVGHMSKRTPVYYLSHGGPNIVEDTRHYAYTALRQIGREITTQVRPRAIVVFCAHWQAGTHEVEVNAAEDASLIYDFYGFPTHYYSWTYPNKGNTSLANHIIALLRHHGIGAQGVARGLDHGVWASFKVAFDPKTNPLNVPIVQVSLFDSDDGVQHFNLGRAIAALRQEGILIICSGQAVHNMRDLRFLWQNRAPLPYTLSFDAALKDAVEAHPMVRPQALNMLLRREDTRRAHPGLEHLLPIFIAAGAAAEDTGRRIWSFCEGSLSWAQFRFGEV